jgi:DNA modification methylase
VTSPPYFGLRDYGVDGQIGRESSVEAYVASLVEAFRAVRRVLADDGTVWLNLGDSYTGGGGFSPNAPSNLAGAKQTTQKGAKPGGIRPTDGLKPKDLIGVPWRVAFALQADGWWLRNDIIWHKPNPMPESVRDRCTRSHEYVFHLAKSARYFHDADAIREAAVSNPHDGRRGDGASYRFKPTAPVTHMGVPEGGRNRRSVWTVTPKPFPGAHFAVMPPDLVEPCILAGSREGDAVLDPFAGAGTVGLVASRLGRRFVGIELNPEYAELAEERIRNDAPLLAIVAD